MPKANLKPANPDVSASNGNGKPMLDPKWIITIEGSEFIKYPGLLDYSLQKGVESLVVEPLQLPNADNGYFAVCKATLVLFVKLFERHFSRYLVRVKIKICPKTERETHILTHAPLGGWEMGLSPKMKPDAIAMITSGCSFH